ncbi:hypothetical protein F5B21DRAFT_459808 [Xylaria acuta]|nr:hypothetical protein F5B21DRAFT_459808 [Xylaria acuta]
MCRVHLTAYNEYQKGYYKKRKENGKCPRCGFQNDDLNVSICTSCRKKNRESQKLWRMKKARKDEVCYPEKKQDNPKEYSHSCGVCANAVSGEAICQNCYKIVIPPGLLRNEQYYIPAAETQVKTESNDDIKLHEIPPVSTVQCALSPMHFDDGESRVTAALGLLELGKLQNNPQSSEQSLLEPQQPRYNLRSPKRSVDYRCF